MYANTIKEGLGHPCIGGSGSRMQSPTIAHQSRKGSKGLLEEALEFQIRLSAKEPWAFVARNPLRSVGTPY